ncbi:hypothetical protein EJ02DRAFT_460349 [Clathrospora elynae]|uniref:Uncharacterized protein n=1 Tax=Clathrospora elynae TaxID=706981 RepID=A0A6A5S6B4_9PLEO|nr:hypothetical protein EJ02DRAFT_460349 [Clathrospora elynae]
MQAPPAVEGMLLHGILHRAEGDFNNARAWVSDVEDACEGFQPKKREEETRLEDEVFEKVQSGNAIRDSLISYVYKSESPTQLIDDVEAFRSKKASERTNGEEEDIEDRIRKEAGKVLEWCTSKFGAGAWTDATKAWVKNSEEISKMSGDMISGGKGYREF